MPILLICLTIVYGLLAAFVWRFQRSGSDKPYPIKSELLILGGALLAHGFVVWWPVLGGKLVILGFGYSISLIVWLMLMLYFAGSFFYRLRGLQLLLYPIAALSMLAAIVFPGHYTGYLVANWPFVLHIASSLLAYGLFGITALLAVLILWLDRHLHQHRFSPMVSFLPPLLSLEKLMFQGMWAGFLLLTVSVASGTFFSEEIFGVAARFSHKTVFGILSWLIYAGLLFKRHQSGWRGKKVAVWSIVGFASLMLAYVGSKFVLEVMLHKGG